MEATAQLRLGGELGTSVPKDKLYPWSLGLKLKTDLKDNPRKYFARFTGIWEIVIEIHAGGIMTLDEGRQRKMEASRDQTSGS